MENKRKKSSDHAGLFTVSTKTPLFAFTSSKNFHISQNVLWKVIVVETQILSFDGRCGPAF